jgi:hypothetical protein
MDANELDLGPDSLVPGGTWEEADASAPIEPGPAPDEAGARRPGLLAASWRGAKAGIRWMSYILGPIFGLGLLMGLAVVEFGLGTGHGFAVPPFMLGAIGGYLVSAAWGAVIGAVVGLTGGLIGRGRSGTRRASWWSAANRPIRLFRRSQTPSTPVRVSLPRPVWRRWPFWLGVPVQLLIIGAFGAGAYLSWQVNRRLADATAAADRDDPDWRLDDLLAHRDPVPDSENSALVVAEALTILPEGWPMPPTPPGSMRSPPTAVSEAVERLGAMENNARPDAATVDAIRGELERYREAVRIARTLVFYDRGRHELEIGPAVIDTLLSETQAARTLARLLAADAVIRADDGDVDGGLDSCRAILATGRSIGDEPFAISQLVRVAIGSVAMNSTRRVLAQGEPSDEALARLQALVLDERDQPLLLYGVRGERAGFIEIVRRVRDGAIPIAALSDSRKPPDLGAYRTAVAPWGKLMYDNQMAIGLEWLNQAVEIAQRPAAERTELWKAWDAEIARVKRTWHSPYSALLPMLTMPAIPSAGSAHSRYEAELGAMSILLAAERHRHKTGAWPQSVAAIDREILQTLPLDPFSGGAYRMEHRDGRLFIYSIGPNRIDEDGAYDPKQWGKGRVDDVGAIGWDVNLRRQPAPSGDEESGDGSPSP